LDQEDAAGLLLLDEEQVACLVAGCRADGREVGQRVG
jgi:hypothetical protein